MALLQTALLHELEALRAAAAPPPLPALGAGAQPQPQPRRLDPGALRRLDCLLRGDAVLERALEHVDAGDVERCVTPHGRAFFAVASASARAARARGAAPPAFAAADAPSQASSQAFPRASFGGAGLGGAGLGGAGLGGGGHGGGAGATAALAYTVLVEGTGACSCFDFSSRVLLGSARMRLGIVDARHARAIIALPPEEGEGGGEEQGQGVGQQADAAAGAAAAAEGPSARGATSSAALAAAQPRRRLCKHLLAALLAQALGRYRQRLVSDEEFLRAVAFR